MNIVPFPPRRPRGKVHVPTVTLAHGGGGKAMKDLIDDVFVAAFDNPLLAPLDDQARIDLAELARMATGWPSPPIRSSSIPWSFPAATSASWRSAARSTISRSAARVPLYLSCAVIIEEGVCRSNSARRSPARWRRRRRRPAFRSSPATPRS